MSNAFVLGPSTALVAAAPAPAQDRIRIDADDRALILFGLRKILLTWVTLGIYHFWGRAEAKRRIYAAISIEGHRPTWTGTGARTFRNFLIALLVSSPGLWLLFGYIPQGLSGFELRLPSGFFLRRIYIGMPLIFLLGSAVYRRRSHLFRNTWILEHNLRMTGGAWSYAWTHFWTSLVVPLSLGWAVPWRTDKLARRIASEQSYAGHVFSYGQNSTGNDSKKSDWHALIKPFAWIWAASILVYAGMMLALALVAGPHLIQFVQTRSLAPLIASGTGSWALAIVVVAIALFYLIAKVWMALTLRHQAHCTRLGAARFILDLPVAGYVWMTASNLLLRVVSLGVLTPWCEVRHWRFLMRHLEILGPLPRPAETDAYLAAGRR